MARIGGRLSALEVTHARKPGMLFDGGGLYLQVSHAHARSWIFRYFRDGKSHEMGLGSLKAVGLAAARAKAAESRALLADGVDPIVARRTERAEQTLQAAHGMTFNDCADAYIKSHSSGWKNQKHAAQWATTIRNYVSLIFGSLPVQAIDVALVMKVLEPIWATKTETAARIRGRIEAVLNWGKARGYRTGDNPAQWKGHLQNLLPAPSKLRSVVHHAALSHTEMGIFIEALRARGGEQRGRSNSRS